jgi:glycosyltransferase involved in cell wall biosynthesis
LSARIGGGVTYLKQILPALARSADRHEIGIVLSPQYQRGIIAGLPPEIRLEPADLPGGALLKRWWYQQHGLPRLVRSRRADVLFAVSEAAYTHVPARLVVLARNPTIYAGLEESGVGAWATFRHRALRQPGVFLALQRADRVVFVSAAFRDEIVPRMRLRRAKTRVVHHGVSDRFREPEPPGTPAGETPYVLSVSDISGHKNYETLLRAFEGLDAPGVELWIAGRPVDARAAERLTQLARGLRLESRVRFLGEVGYEDLPLLYRRALAFVLPSRLETFGHPLVEAMASGTPVIASNLPVCREICEDAALFFSPRSHDELRSQLQAVLADPQLRESLRVRGLRRADSFSWDRSARSLLSVFEELAS